MSDIQNKAEILIPVIRVVNPFNPHEFVRETLVWERAKPLADYFPLGMTEHIVSINGKPVAFEEMAATYLDRTDNLVICPVPLGGGGGGKSIFRLVAMIAITYFTAGAGNGWLLGLTGQTAGTLGAAMVGAGAAMAGSMLLNALLPPPKPTNNTMGGSDLASSPTYGVDGAKNTSAEGLAVPVCYGNYRMAGNVLNLYVENTGPTQYLYMLLNAGEGPVNSLYDIKINDQPLANFKNVEIQTRTGHASQDMIPWFADTVTPHSVGRKLVTGEYVNYLTEGPVDRMRFDVVFPQGLGTTDPTTGARNVVNVHLSIQVRKQGTANWINCGEGHVAGYRPIFHYVLPAVQTPIYDTSGRFPRIIGWSTQPATTVTVVGEPLYFPEPGAPQRTDGLFRWIGSSGVIVPPGYVSHLPPDYFFIESTGKVYQNVTETVYVPNTGADDGGGYTTYDVVRQVEVGYFDRDPIYSPNIRVTENSTSPVRRSFYSPVLEQGIYECRLLRVSGDSDSVTVQDDAVVTDINEIILDDVAYVNTALVAVKVQLDDQLNGIPNVTFMNGGRIVRVFNHTSKVWEDRASANPAWIVLDALTHGRYGASMSYARFDLEMFKEWALYCEQNNLTFNAVVDTVGNVWDAMQPVLRCGHAQVVNVGTRFTVIIERQAKPTMMFGVGNIIEGSFKQTWLGMADRANEIDVTYFDREDNYKQRSVRVVDQAAIARGDKQRPAAITLIGVVDRERAYKEGWFQLNLNRYILQTIEFSAPLEAIACSVGDLIYVQHDMPQWGFAGRLDAGSTATSIMLDREVSMEEGKQYKLLLKLDAVLRGSGSLVSVVGDSLVLAGWNGQGRVRRIKTGGIDRAVLSSFNAGGGNYGVVVEPGAYAPGAAYELWDTDVIEERDIVVAPGEQITLTPMSPFSVAPPQFINWMFGEVGKVKKPFRVRMVSGSHEYKRDLTCIEYNESCYDLSGAVLPTPNYSSLDTVLRHVSIDGTSEMLVRSGAGLATRVTVSFHSTQDTYAGSTVKASVNGSEFRVIASGARESAYVDAQNGEVVVFKIIANDSLGSVAPESTAPMTTHTVVGTAYPPSNVTGFAVKTSLSSLVLSWDQVPDLDLKCYELREGASWDNSTLLIAGFVGTSYSVPKSEPGTYNFMIRAVDTGGRLSTSATLTAITLNPPAAVSGFDCVQNGDRIEFRWSPNRENYLVGYELREGLSWSTAKLVTQTAATTYSMPTNSVTGVRTFWIKAIVEPGVHGTTAVFSNTNVAVSSDRNLIYSTDELALGWSGSKYRVELSGNALQMQDGYSYAEYTWPVSLPATYRARSSIDSGLGAVLLDAVSWAEAAWSWSSQQAERGWVVSGDLSSATLSYSISVYTGLDPLTYLEGFGLHGSTTGDLLTPASTAIGVTYGEGRFLQGAVLTNFTQLAWNIALPAEFNTTFWAIPTAITGKQVYWTGSTASGHRLICSYDSATASFCLEDNLGQCLTVPFELTVGERVLFGIVQTAALRRFYVGAINGVPASASAAFAPIGAIVQVKLNQ